jgi:hypothetical protein
MPEASNRFPHAQRIGISRFGSSPLARQPQLLDTAAELAAIMNQVVALAIGVYPRDGHRLLANDASHQIQQWAPIVIH